MLPRVLLAPPRLQSGWLYLFKSALNEVPGVFTTCIGFQPITDTKHHFLKSLFLLSPWTRWNCEHCPQHGHLDALPTPWHIPLDTTPWLLPLLDWLSVLTSVPVACPPPPTQLQFQALVLWLLAHPHCLTRPLALPSCCPVLGLSLIWEITSKVSLQDTQEFLTNILSRPAWGGELIRKDRKKYCVCFFSVWGKTVNDTEKWQKWMKWLSVIQSPGDTHNDWAGKYPFNHLSASAPIKICVYQLSWMNPQLFDLCFSLLHLSQAFSRMPMMRNMLSLFQECKLYSTAFFFFSPPAHLHICFFGGRNFTCVPFPSHSNRPPIFGWVSSHYNKNDTSQLPLTVCSHVTEF